MDISNDLTEKFSAISRVDGSFFTHLWFVFFCFLVFILSCWRIHKHSLSNFISSLSSQVSADDPQHRLVALPDRWPYHLAYWAQLHLGQIQEFLRCNVVHWSYDLCLCSCSLSYCVLAYSFLPSSLPPSSLPPSSSLSHRASIKDASWHGCIISPRERSRPAIWKRNSSFRLCLVSMTLIRWGHCLFVLSLCVVSLCCLRYWLCSLDDFII